MTVPWEAKAWGRVWHFRQDIRVLGDLLEVQAGHRSSWHKHTAMDNHFAVLSGAVVIEQVDPITQHLKVTVLRASQSLLVAACVFHRFRVIESGTLIETYTPAAPRSKDIVRFDQGGQDDVDQLRRFVDRTT